MLVINIIRYIWKQINIILKNKNKSKIVGYKYFDNSSFLNLDMDSQSDISLYPKKVDPMKNI